MNQNYNPLSMTAAPTIGTWNYGSIGGSPAEVGPSGNITPAVAGPYGGISAPAYNNPYNPATMSMESQYNQAPLNTFANQAMRTGPSTWAQLQDAQQNQLAANANDQSVARGNSETADTDSRLAQQGGLTSGARERAAEAGQKDTTAAIQNNQKQNSMNQMQVGVNDESNRMSQLGQLPGMELQSLQPFQTDVQNTMAAANSANQYNTAQQQMYNQAVASNQQANATAASGKK